MRFSGARGESERLPLRVLRRVAAAISISGDPYRPFCEDFEAPVNQRPVLGAVCDRQTGWVSYPHSRDEEV
jgi:hypothetical protein